MMSSCRSAKRPRRQEQGPGSGCVPGKGRADTAGTRLQGAGCSCCPGEGKRRAGVSAGRAWAAWKGKGSPLVSRDISFRSPWPLWWPSSGAAPSFPTCAPVGSRMEGASRSLVQVRAARGLTPRDVPKTLASVFLCFPLTLSWADVEVAEPVTGEMCRCPCWLQMSCLLTAAVSVVAPVAPPVFSWGSLGSFLLETARLKWALSWTPLLSPTRDHAAQELPA